MVECVTSQQFNVFANGELVVAYTDIASAWEPHKYSLTSDSTKKEIEFLNVEYRCVRVNTQIFSEVLVLTRQGSPVDDRPSTDKLHHFVKKNDT